MGACAPRQRGVLPCLRNGDTHPVTVARDFWATSAQTLPVLALAQVVEARSIMARWGPGKWSLLQRFQVTFWTLPMIAYAYCIPLCFRALLGEEVADYNAVIVSQSVTAGISILVGSPILEFFLAANARALGRVVTVRPFQRLRIRWYIRQILRSIDAETKAVQEILTLANERIELIDSVKADPERVMNLPPDAIEEIDRLYAEGKEQRLDGVKRIELAAERRVEVLRAREEGIESRQELLDEFESYMRTVLIPNISLSPLPAMIQRPEPQDGDVVSDNSEPVPSSKELNGLGWPENSDGSAASNHLPGDSRGARIDTEKS